MALAWCLNCFVINPTFFHGLEKGAFGGVAFWNKQELVKIHT